MITKYHTLSLDELLRHVQDKRGSSPIVEELCTRLEQLDSQVVDAYHEHVDCPVCETTLKILEDNGSFKLTVTKE